jgi:hypothetical protein
MLGGYFKLNFIIAEVGNLDINLEGYFKLILFVITDVDNLFWNIGGYFELSL